MAATAGHRSAHEWAITHVTPPLAETPQKYVVAELWLSAGSDFQRDYPHAPPGQCFCPLKFYAGGCWPEYRLRQPRLLPLLVSSRWLYRPILDAVAAGTARARL